MAVPPGVFSVTLPVTAPAPTVAVTCVSEFTVNVAFALPMVTLVVCLRLMPVIVTCVPTGPLLGLKLEMVGMILNFCGVVRLPPGSNTVMTPVVAPATTVVVIKASELATNVPAPVPNFTPVAFEKP